jgi:hypothetical protein
VAELDAARLITEQIDRAREAARRYGSPLIVAMLDAEPDDAEVKPLDGSGPVSP